MDTVHIGCKTCSSKTGSDTLKFTVQPYGVPAKIPLWLIGLGVGAVAIAIIAAATRKT
jgi:hypothetical protein